MRATNPGPSRWVWFSPVMIIGSVCILAGILLILAVKNINREKQFMERALLSQANVLMRSVEAGSRTGMMGNGWGRQRRQTLIEEMAQQSEILYLALVDSMGRIIAHSDPEQVGKTLSPAFPRAGETSCRFTDKDPGAFEVMRTFQPWCRQSGRGPRNRFGWNSPESQRDLFIIAGLDPAPFEDAGRQDLHQTILVFVIMFLVGAAGFISLVWAQNYRTAKYSLRQMKAFTSTIINQMPVGLIMTDPEGRIERTNEAARIILHCYEKAYERIDDLPCFLPIEHELKKTTL